MKTSEDTATLRDGRTAKVGSLVKNDRYVFIVTEIQRSSTWGSALVDKDGDVFNPANCLPASDP